MIHALTLFAAMVVQRVAQVHHVEATAAVALYRDLNNERRAHGLPPLVLDPRLGAAAIAHVTEMGVRRYFGHESPGGVSPFDRMREAGCRYGYAGENIAQAPSERSADSALYASLPHRDNTLSPFYRRVGIAAMLAPNGELLFVEDFTD